MSLWPLCSQGGGLASAPPPLPSQAFCWRLCSEHLLRVCQASFLVIYFTVKKSSLLSVIQQLHVTKAGADMFLTHQTSLFAFFLSELISFRWEELFTVCTQLHKLAQENSKNCEVRGRRDGTSSRHMFGCQTTPVP